VNAYCEEMNQDISIRVGFVKLTRKSYSCERSISILTCKLDLKETEHPLL
jgi:hypothetical protein